MHSFRMKIYNICNASIFHFMSKEELLLNITWFLSWLTLFLWPLPWVPTSSIPLVLFIGLFAFKRKWLLNTVFRFRSILVLLVLFLVFGFVFSQLPQKSLKGSYDFLRGVVFFFPALYLTEDWRERFRKAFCTALCGGFSVLLVFAIWAWRHGGGGLRGFQDQLILFGGHYNSFATCVGTVGVLAVSGLLWGRFGKVFCWFSLLFLVLSSLLTFMTGSRGSFVALLIVVCYSCYLRFKNLRKLILIIGCLFFVAICILVIFGWFGENVSVWYRDGDFSSGRLKLFYMTINAVIDHNLLFGFGINTFKYLSVAQPFDDVLPFPHNVILEVFFSQGVVGIIVLSGIIFILMKKACGAVSNQFLYYSGLLILNFYFLRGMLDMKFFSQYYPAALCFGYALMFGSVDSESDLLTTV